MKILGYIAALYFLLFALHIATCFCYGAFCALKKQWHAKRAEQAEERAAIERVLARATEIAEGRNTQSNGISIDYREYGED